MSAHDVVIAGGGPTGLMLAAELTLAGVEVVVVERRASQALDGSRAGGLHSRTIEVLDQRGVADRFLAAGTRYPSVGYAQARLDMSDFPTRHNYLLGLWQSDIERILAGWVEELGVVPLRSREVAGFTADDAGVDVVLADGSTLRTAFLVGCDGGHSVVRTSAQIEFAGWDASTSWLIAEVEMTDEPEVGVRPEGGGIGPIDREVGGSPYRVVLRERLAEHAAEPTLDELRVALSAVYGSDYGAHSPTRISRFDDTTRQAVSYRKGRVLLAGDAAHVHPPQGGQGLNVGVQDAVNLGWKLAQVVKGISPDSLLDTYHAERHQIGARVLRNTMAQVALATPDDRHQALGEQLAELLSMDEPRRYLAGMLSGLDVHYDIGEGHPLLGRRMPDLDLETAGGHTRVFDQLRDARPVLLNLGEPSGFDLAPWAQRVRLVEASHLGEWVLPVIGAVAAPPAVLIRPDGHVAWTGEMNDAALPGALDRWFGSGVSGGAAPGATLERGPGAARHTGEAAGRLRPVRRSRA